MTKFIDQHLSKLKQLGEIYVDAHSPLPNHSLNRYRAQDGQGYSELYEFDRFCVGKGEYQLQHALQLTADLDAHDLGITLLLSGTHIIKNHYLNQSYHLNSPMILLRKGRLGAQTIYLQAQVKMALITCDFDYHLLEKLKYSGARNDFYQFFNQPQSSLIATHKLLNKDILHQAQYLLKLQPAKTQIDLIHLEGAALELLSTLFRSQNHSGCALIDHAIEIIEHRFQDKITIAALARQVGINECDLKRAFKATTGQTIADYILNIRMQHAQRLLKDGLSTAQVAEKIGYSSPQYFRQVFVRHFGYSP